MRDEVWALAVVGVKGRWLCVWGDGEPRGSVGSALCCRATYPVTRIGAVLALVICMGACAAVDLGLVSCVMRTGGSRVEYGKVTAQILGRAVDRCGGCGGESAAEGWGRGGCCA